MFEGTDFLGAERNFTSGQSLKIWGNFSKICIKINKNFGKIIEKIREKCKLLGYILIFGQDYGKIRNII